MKAETLRDLQTLADAVIDHRATEREIERLNRWLAEDAAAQEAWLDYLDTHAGLCWAFRGATPAGPRDGMSADAAEAPPNASPGVGHRPRTGWLAVLGWSAAGVLAVGLLLAAVLPAVWEPRPQHDSTTADVADATEGFGRVVDAVGARYRDDEGPAVGQRIGAGRWRLAAGLVELALDNGVRAVIAGPADLELVGPMRGFLHSGRVVCRVPPQAIGFTLETTEAEVIDLGTEFGVHSHNTVGTEVQVYAGEVVAEFKSPRPASPRSQRLQGGEAVRIAKGADTVPQALNFWPERFVRYLPDPADPEAPHDPSRRRVSPYNKPAHEAIRIPRAPQTVTIDGALDDWDLSGQFTSRCEPPYDSFYHLQAAMMYDDQALYIGAIVGDPFPMRSTVSPHEERNLYGNGGCLAFRISTDRQMGWPVQGQGPGTDAVRVLSPEDRNDQLVFLVLWFYEPEGTACLHVKYGMDQHGRLVNPEGYRGAYRKHADGWGYTAEYAIPWHLLNAADDPPQPGDQLGCTWLVHWAGPEGRNWKGQLIDVVNPQATGWNFQDAATWGRALYLPPESR